MSSKFGKNKFRSQAGIAARLQNTRNEKTVAGEIPLLVFSFKDFDIVQCPPGQTFEEWEQEGLLSSLMTKLVELSQKNRVTAAQQGCISVYGSFPDDSGFRIPRFIEGDVDWAVIKDIGGQKHRVAGYIVDNIFYVVFLDKAHKFYITNK